MKNGGICDERVLECDSGDFCGCVTIPIGSYRGFAMELTYDSFRKDFEIILKGSMSHRATLGTDARGNITRLDNCLAAMPDRLQKVQDTLENLYNQ